MREIEFAANILNDIIYNDVPFSTALKEASKNIANLSKIKSTVSALVGCELRHHILFENIILDKDVELTNEEKCLAYVVLGNNLFLKRLPNDDTIKYLEEKIKDKIAPLKEVLVFEGSPNELISNKIDKESLEYLSIRFNTPTWLVKMWQKHYGRGLTFKILKKNNKPHDAYCIVNTFLTSIDEILKKHPCFVKSEYPNVISYIDKSSLRRQDVCKEGYVIQEKLAINQLLSQQFNGDVKELLLFDADDTSAIYQALFTFKKDIGMNLAVAKGFECIDVRRLISLNQLKNVNFFEADPLNMDASISHKQDLVVAFPKSSNFDDIRTYPDYLFHFKREIIDELIVKQKEAIEGLSKFVEVDGKLVYLVSTLNRKEGHSIVIDFLQRHKEFELIEEKQRFPFDQLDTALYYAVMKRNEIKDD